MEEDTQTPGIPVNDYKQLVFVASLPLGGGDGGAPPVPPRSRNPTHPGEASEARQLVVIPNR